MVAKHRGGVPAAVGGYRQLVTWSIVSASEGTRLARAKKLIEASARRKNCEACRLAPAGGMRYVRVLLDQVTYRMSRCSALAVLLLSLALQQAPAQQPAPAQTPALPRCGAAGADPQSAADPRRHPARRVRPLPRQQRSALLPPRRPRRLRRRIDQRQEHDPLQDAEGRHAHPARSLRQPRTSTRSCSGTTPLKYERELDTVFVDFPETLKAGRDVLDRLLLLRHAEGAAAASAASRSGKDPAGHGTGSTPPAKARAPASGGRTRTSGATKSRTWRSASPIPNGLVDVSNGKFVGKTDLGDGYTRWDWQVHYPINNYDVSLNIGNYVHFADTLGDLPLDFYVLPEDLDKAQDAVRAGQGR